MQCVLWDSNRWGKLSYGVIVYDSMNLFKIYHIFSDLDVCIPVLHKRKKVTLFDDVLGYECDVKAHALIFLE